MVVAVTEVVKEERGGVGALLSSVLVSVVAASIATSVAPFVVLLSGLLGHPEATVADLLGDTVPETKGGK